MKRIGQWIRSCTGRLLDLLGRFRLMTILKAAVIVAVILFTLSLLLSNRIAQGLIHSEYEEYNETIFRQAETAINRSVFDLSQLCYIFMSNDTVAEYLSAPTFKERTAMMDSLNAEFDRLIILQSDIKSILLYDLSGKMIASASSGASPAPALIMADSITFSGRTSVNNRDFFSIHLPVYSLDASRRSQKIGYCQMLVSMDFLRRSLEAILPNQDYFCLLTDGQGEPLLQEGEIPPDILKQLLAMEDFSSEPEGQVLYQARLDRTPWTIHFGVPQKQLYASINLLQQNYTDMTRDYPDSAALFGHLTSVFFDDPEEALLTPVLEEIEAHYACNRTLADLGQELGVSQAYLSQLIRRRTGKTYSELVQEKRMARAKELLAYTEIAVMDIAIEVGYSDQFYFSKLFKRLWGMSPNAWRKQACSGNKITKSEMK